MAYTRLEQGVAGYLDIDATNTLGGGFMAAATSATSSMSPGASRLMNGTPQAPKT
jgi:hypothetical protein